MKSEWCFFDKAITDEECDTLLSHLEERYEYLEPSIGFGEDSKVNETFRKCKVAWAHPYKEEKIVKLLWYYVQRANRDHFNFDLQYINEIQLTKYEGDTETPGKYNWHHDVDWLAQGTFHRKLSLSLILSDGYEGGELEFDSLIPQLPKEALQKGSIIFFPSFTIHRVAPVTSGTRNSIVTWVEGPKWR